MDSNRHEGISQIRGRKSKRAEYGKVCGVRVPRVERADGVEIKAKQTLWKRSVESLDEVEPANSRG
jgi:hypothetical protein